MPMFRVNFTSTADDADPDRLEWQTVYAKSAMQAVRKAMRTLDADKADEYLHGGDFDAWVWEEGALTYEDGTPLECRRMTIGVDWFPPPPLADRPSLPLARAVMHGTD